MIGEYRKYLICRIKYDGESPFFYDCKNLEIKSTNAMNMRYRKARRQIVTEEDGATIWILTGILKQDGEEKLIQVGQCKNLTQMLSGDIRKDVRQIISENDPNGKYSTLRQEYKELFFYEVELDDFDICDIGVKLCFPIDTILKRAERAIKAAYVEGMIASQNNCLKNKSVYGIWNPSTIGLDGYFYSYFESKTERGK